MNTWKLLSPVVGFLTTTGEDKTGLFFMYVFHRTYWCTGNNVLLTLKNFSIMLWQSNKACRSSKKGYFKLYLLRERR